MTCGIMVEEIQYNMFMSTSTLIYTCEMENVCMENDLIVEFLSVISS